MTADDLTAYLNQNPDAVDRVEALEQGRTTPRKTVLAMVEAHREAQAAANG
jgi:hypothetical protein